MLLYQVRASFRILVLSFLSRLCTSALIRKSDTKTKYDEETQEPREETLAMSLLSPQDKPQKIKQIIPETSLPSPPPKTPNTATTQPLVSPTNQPLYTPKRPQDFRHQDIYFAIKWARGILTVAASIIFRIRAPLSYEATISDNDTQNIMVTVLSNAKELASTANKTASNAQDTASAQHEAMGALLSTIGLMGQQLAVMEFCHGQQVRGRLFVGVWVSGLLSLIDVEHLHLVYTRSG